MMQPVPQSARRRGWIACLILLALPALFLFESLFLGNDYVPFDHRVFPPASASLTQDAIDKLQRESNWQITEKTLLVVPEFKLAKQELAEGRLPHYNPWIRSGAPLFANVLDGFAYPLHLPLFFGRIEARFAIVAFLAFALAGLFMFGFLQSLKLTWVAALFGAITFQLSGTLAANGHFYMRMETLAWLPAGFWALQCYKDSQSLRAALGFAVVLAMTWLAGFPPFALVCSLAFGARIATIVIAHLFTREKSPVRATALLGGACVLGLGLACIQLVPMLDYFPEAQRNLSQSLDELASQGIDPVALLGLSMPYPFGSPIGDPVVEASRNPLIAQMWTRTSPTTGKLFSEINYNYTEYALYLGVLPTVCALVALVRGARFRYFALAAFAGAFVLAMGGAVFQALAELPIIKSTPPMRFVGLCAFFGATLAAIGFDSLTQTVSKVLRRSTEIACGALAAVSLGIALWSRGLADAPERAVDHMVDAVGSHWMSSYPSVAGSREQLVGLFGANAAPAYAMFSHEFLVLALSLFAITIWLVALPYVHEVAHAKRRRVLIGLAVGATAAFLMIHARHVNPSCPPPADASSAASSTASPTASSTGEAPNSVIAFLREKRIEHAKNGGFTVARVAAGPELPVPVPPLTLTPERIRDLNGYGFVDARSHRPFVGLYGPGQMIRQYWLRALPVDARLNRGLFDMFGVRYWIAKKSFEALGEPVFSFDDGGRGQTKIYENPNVLPRAWLVASAQLPTGESAEAQDEAVTKRLIAEDFDPRTELWLHDTEASSIAKPAASGDAIAASTLTWTKDEPTSLAIEIEKSPGAWLVLSDAFYSHWNASIDGAAQPWQRANLYNRAIWVPEGDHVVSFDYEAKPFRYGLIATLLSLFVLLVGFVVAWRASKRAQPQRAEPKTPDVSEPDKTGPTADDELAGDDATILAP